MSQQSNHHRTNVLVHSGSLEDELEALGTEGSLSERANSWAARALAKGQRSHLPSSVREVADTLHQPNRYRVFTTEHLEGLAKANPQATRSAYDVKGFTESTLLTMIEWGLIGGNPMYQDCLYGPFSQALLDKAKSKGIADTPGMMPGFFEEGETDSVFDTPASKRGAMEYGSERASPTDSRGKSSFPSHVPSSDDEDLNHED